MSVAWVLDLGVDRRVAVAQRQQLQLVHEPQVCAVAWAPACAQNVLLWNGHCIPVLDFGTWSNAEPTPRGLLGIYAYFNDSLGTHQFGGLWLAAPPVRVDVDDSQDCELPLEREPWRPFSLSCFRDAQSNVVPIIELAQIFLKPTFSTHPEMTSWT